MLALVVLWDDIETSMNTSRGSCSCIFLSDSVALFVEEEEEEEAEEEEAEEEAEEEED